MSRSTRAILGSAVHAASRAGGSTGARHPQQPAFGIFEREGQGLHRNRPDCRKRTLQRVIRGKVSLESVIHSDGWRGYNGLTSSPVTGTATSTASSLPGYTKRRLAKFNGVQQNFELHLKESEWRWRRGHYELAGELWFLLRKYQHLLV